MSRVTHRRQRFVVAESGGYDLVVRTSRDERRTRDVSISVPVKVTNSAYGLAVHGTGCVRFGATVNDLTTIAGK